MAVRKELYVDWVRNPVTEALKEELRVDVENLVAEMIRRDRPDADRDQYVRAFVKVADAVISWTPEFVKTEEEIVDDQD